MFSAANKTNKIFPAVQQKTAGSTFFRKAGEDLFFGGKENPAFFKSSVQAKLTVSTPDDPQEKEADEVADKVMRMPEPIVAAPLSDKNEEKLQRKDKEEEEVQANQELPLVSKIQCKAEPEEKLYTKGANCHCGAKEDTRLHTKPVVASSNTSNGNRIFLYPSDVLRQSGRAPPAGSVPFEQTLASSKGGGSALPGDSQKFMESRFNADFSSVRIHTDATAASLSRSVNAQAFAHGNDIYFNSGKFTPGSTEGKTLLAHELTHTLQQGASKSIQPAYITSLARKDGITRKINSAITADNPTSGIFKKDAIPGTGGKPVKHLFASRLTDNIRQSQLTVSGIRSGKADTIQRSPLADEIQNVWNTQGKGAFFERLRREATSDPDVLLYVNSMLQGDDRWLALNILNYGREASWPIHLKVEREMKGWADSGGKGVVFDMLRTANAAEAGNAALTASLNRVFGAGTDDIWLASSLQQHGPEASWPIHLKVEREMKGWADSGGKGVVFDMLRTANAAEAGNAALTASLNRVFGAGTDDIWLASNLQQHGPEANWPIHLRVEREMKGWADSGGKGVVFDMLRTANAAEAGNAALTASLNRVFGAGTDDIWLASNLQQHGPEASWPIHLRVEREMKGWADSGGKGVVFEILRADNGAHAGKADLTSTITLIFAPGSEDLVLSQNLQHYGPENRWPVPAITYDVPFDRNPLSEAGEQIIFNEEFEYPPVTQNYHQIIYHGAGGKFDSASGPADKTISGLNSGNVYYFINSSWTGTTPVTVRCEVQCKSNRLTVETINWVFKKKVNKPSTITQLETEGERPLGSTYNYQLGPDIGPAGTPDYEHQTVLELFAAQTCNITMAELKPAFRLAHPEIITPELLAIYFMGGSSSNGTFTIDASDQIADIHSGMPNLPTFQNALITMKEVHINLPQAYEISPGVVLGRYNVRRKIKADGTKFLEKRRLP